MSLSVSNKLGKTSHSHSLLLSSSTPIMSVLKRINPGKFLIIVLNDHKIYLHHGNHWFCLLGSIKYKPYFVKLYVLPS